VRFRVAVFRAEFFLAEVVRVDSSFRIRRLRDSTSAVVASPARPICFVTSRPIVSRIRSLFFRDHSRRSRASWAAWSLRAWPSLTRERASSSARWGVSASRPASTYLRTASSMRTSFLAPSIATRTRRLYSLGFPSP
jgi:hypothetical protein